MDYEFEMEKPFILTTADMLEIAASGANGSEYVDIVGLMENAAKELREKDAEIERLREALKELLNVIPNFPPAGNFLVGMLERYNKALIEARAALKEGE